MANLANYHGVILTEISRNMLLNYFGVPKGWTHYGHHMTICYGKPLPPSLEGDYGRLVRLEVTHVGQNDLVKAVRVKGYHSDNKVPHVTLSVNKKKGGKPVMSNDIENWEPLTGLMNPFIIEGIVG
jgi:hypothetical protein